MKFALNGGLILGTADGANIEIADAIGAHNMFTFGADVEEVEAIRAELRAGQAAGKAPPPLDARLQEVLDLLQQVRSSSRRGGGEWLA